MIFNRAFPLCWRCTSATLSIIFVSVLVEPLIRMNPVFIGICLILLGFAGFDGYRSYRMPGGTTNIKRVVYGACLGVGAAGLFIAISEWQI